MRSVNELRDEYAVTVDGFNGALKAAEEIAAAVKARLESERNTAAARTAVLEARIADPDTTTTARSMYKAEISRIQARTFAATPEEAAAFESEIEKGEAALTDLRALRRELHDALTAAQEELAAIRTDTIGDKNADLRCRWVEGRRAEFSRLMEG